MVVDDCLVSVKGGEDEARHAGQEGDEGRGLVAFDVRIQRSVSEEPSLAAAVAALADGGVPHQGFDIAIVLETTRAVSPGI